MEDLVLRETKERQDPVEMQESKVKWEKKASVGQRETKVGQEKRE